MTQSWNYNIYRFFFSLREAYLVLAIYASNCVCDSFSIFLQKINIVEHVEEGLKAGEFRHFYKCYVRQNNIHSVLESFLKSLKQKNGWKQIIFDI